METWFVCLILVFAGVFVQSTRGSSELLSRDRRSAEHPRLTLAELKEALSAHNYVRTLEGSSDMQTLRYNHFLASLAETWAQQCLWDHGQPADSRAGLGYDYVGQNLYYIYGVNSINLTDATMAWYNEKPFYTYETMACRPNKVCGHYTQVVWAGTYEIGCAYYKCPTLRTKTATEATDAFYYVCNYGPGGNIVGQKPFQKGSGCTKCSNGQFWCSQNLCDRDCSSSSGRNCECSAPCQYGASVIRSNCSCKCAAGYTGVDCSKLCKNYDNKCDPPPYQYGWPPSMCNEDYVQKSCPLMCKLCTYSETARIVEPVSTANRLRVLMSTATLHSSWIAVLLFGMLNDLY